MRIECVKEKLLNAVNQAERITGKNTALPVLKCILLEANNNLLTIKATNLDLGLEITIPVKVHSAGVLAVSGGVLNNLLNNLYQDKNVILESVDGNLSVQTNNNTTLIKTIPHEEFPIIPLVSKENSFDINGKDFIKGLKNVWYSSAMTSIKPELSSVYIYQEDDNLVFVATDSFRLAEKKIKTKKIKDFGQILIPHKNIPDIIRVLEKSDDVEVCLDKNQISFKCDGLYLTSRVIDSAFPDYKQIIPKDFKTTVVLLKDDLISSLKLVNIFSDQFNQVKLSINNQQKTLILRSKNADVGENENKLISTIKGESIDINFNYRYIMDCFQSIDSDSISIEFNGNSRPVIIKGLSDKTFMYLVMPMNR